MRTDKRVHAYNKQQRKKDYVNSKSTRYIQFYICNFATMERILAPLCLSSQNASKLLTTSLSLLRQNSRFQSVFFYAVKGLIFLLLAFPSTTHPALTQNLFPNGDLNSVYAHLG